MGAVGIAPSAGRAFEELVERLYGGGIAPLVSQQLWESVQAGHTALPLEKLEAAYVQATLMALAQSPEGLLRVEGGHLYLARFRAMEVRIAEHLLALANAPLKCDWVGIETAMSNLEHAPNKQQRRAIEQALGGRLLLLTGGPGTGKSFTLRALVQVLRQVAPGLRIAALAPTASAAQRLANVGADFVGTVHKALGIAPSLQQTKSGSGVSLPYDLVIVDEATMLSAQLADTLFSALLQGGRLVLAGDRYQLASVEAGAIFAQACSLERALVQLEENIRFANFPELARFSQMIVQQDIPATEVLKAAEPFRRPGYCAVDIVREAVTGYLPLLEHARLASDTGGCSGLIQAMRAFRLIVATNDGPHGLEQLSGRLEELLRGHGSASRQATWYVGRLIVVLRNDAASGLRNGQTGVCIRRDGHLQVYFDEHLSLDIARLPMHRSAWAITVHKAQGDEYENVLFVLPQANSPLALRELLYTAATRARSSLGLVSDDHSLLACCTQFAQRDGGLRWRFIGNSQR
jgi:exodeoxyribonuclease V alpha subunit